MGWLGLQRILASGGSGYFPLRLLREHELAGRLHLVADAPEFRLPAYLCYPTKTDSDALALALDTIRRVAADAA
jgi:LysR family transcriptional regulator, flagellar master operon regulator